METPQRKFKVKAVDFIIAADTIIDSAIANQPFLETKRANWTMPFFQAIKQQIDDATQSYLGMDSARELRLATQQVYTIQGNALTELAELKVQIEEDFKDIPTQKKEILNTLGFTAHIFNARKGDQEALIDLLFQFKTNLSSELNDTLVEKGIAQASIDKAIDFADQLRVADVRQEGKKATRKELTAEAITELNIIYEKIISICRISAKFFKVDKAKSDQFSFAKVAKAINYHSKKE
ncbi:hypothetical protein [Flavobacterium sp.]